MKNITNLTELTSTFVRSKRKTSEHQSGKILLNELSPHSYSFLIATYEFSFEDNWLRNIHLILQTTCRAAVGKQRPAEKNRGTVLPMASKTDRLTVGCE
jgi:hypothetical protein